MALRLDREELPPLEVPATLPRDLPPGLQNTRDLFLVDDVRRIPLRKGGVPLLRATIEPAGSGLRAQVYPIDMDAAPPRFDITGAFRLEGHTAHPGRPPLKLQLGSQPATPVDVDSLQPSVRWKQRSKAHESGQGDGSGTGGGGRQADAFALSDLLSGAEGESIVVVGKEERTVAWAERQQVLFKVSAEGWRAKKLLREGSKGSEWKLQEIRLLRVTPHPTAD